MWPWHIPRTVKEINLYYCKSVLYCTKKRVGQTVVYGNQSLWQQTTHRAITSTVNDSTIGRIDDTKATRWRLQLEHLSTTTSTSSSPLMYACPLLSLGAHGSYLSISETSGEQHCHTGSLLDYPHCVSLWPLSSHDDTGSSSQGDDLTHSPQSTATSHMPASLVILTQR